MGSWWDLGEHSGLAGKQLAIHEIECAFCYERGGFTIEHHAVKRKPNAGKVLNFDTLRCGNCGGYVLALWSATSMPIDLQGIHDYRVLPWPQRLDQYPSHWPEPVGRHWKQAQRTLLNEDWDAAAVMARSSMQAALRDKGAVGGSLKQEITDLASKGVLPPLMEEWSHHVRELGNDSAHPKPNQPATEPRDAQDIVQFLTFMLQYLYDLPKQIADYRSRR
jgi:hypothetical protein